LPAPVDERRQGKRYGLLRLRVRGLLPVRVLGRYCLILPHHNSMASRYLSPDQRSHACVCRVHTVGFYDCCHLGCYRALAALFCEHCGGKSASYAPPRVMSCAVFFRVSCCVMHACACAVVRVHVRVLCICRWLTHVIAAGTGCGHFGVFASSHSR
jgi:hypothetical protein